MNFHTLSTIHKIQPFGHVFTIQGELEAKQNKTTQNKQRELYHSTLFPQAPAQSQAHSRANAQ